MARWLVAIALLLAGCNAEEVPTERLPRFVPAAGAPQVALVLGSGGPRGFAHIGVLKVLEENGIHPDLVVGASVGAMVGVLYAGGYKATQLETLAKDLNVMQFFEFRMLTGSLASGTTIQSWVNDRVGNLPIERLGIRFAATATRISDHTMVIFNHGDAGLAVRASSASPGQFEAVAVGNERYVDGDEVSPVPIHVARTLGARVVIAVDVSAYEKDTPAGVPQAWIDKDARRARQVASEAGEADVLLHPNIGYYAGHDEQYRRRVMAQAEAYTREQLPRIRAALARSAQRVRETSPSGVASR